MMLVPAAVLVLIVLGAIAVDSAVVFLAQRDLSNRTAGVANDIAGYAVSESSFYQGGGAVELDQSKAASYTGLAFSDDRRPGGFERWSAAASTQGRTVVVVAEADVRLVFAPAIPGVRSMAHVTARSTVSARGG
jgi:Flp pilus assembly protein TadG